MALWRSLNRSKIVWPLVALGALMLFNLFFTPNFFRMEIKEGHLYGNLIDILKNAAPIMLLAIGLTLVIATHGIDISVGSVVAISAGVVAILIGGDLAGHPKYPIALAMGAALLVSTAAGMWNGMLVSRVGMQPIIATLILFVAGRGIAMVFTNAMVIWLYTKPFALLGQGYVLGLPFSIYIVAFVLLLTSIFHKKNRGRAVHRGGGNQPDSGPVLWNQRQEHRFLVLHVQRVLRGGIRVDRVFDGHERRREQCGKPVRAGRDSGRGAGRHVAERRKVLPARQHGGRPDHPDPDHDDLRIQRRARDFPGREGDRGVRRQPAAVRGVPFEDCRGIRQKGVVGMKRKLFVNSGNLPVFVTLGLFVLMFGLGSIAFTGFFSVQNFFNLFIDNAYLLILAVGMTFVIISGGIDLSVGSMLALSTMISSSLVEKSHMSPMLVIPVVLLVGTVLGVFMGYLIQTFKLPPFIITLAGLYLARGLCYVVSIDTIGITNRFFKAAAHSQIDLIGKNFVSPSALIAVVVVLIGLYVSRFTKFGRTVYAIGGNEQSALLMGLPVGEHQDRDLRLERLLLGAGRNRVHLLYPLRLRVERQRAWSWTRSPRS